MFLQILNCLQKWPTVFISILIDIHGTDEHLLSAPPDEPLNYPMH
jgi:hypothetical protein